MAPPSRAPAFRNVPTLRSTASFFAGLGVAAVLFMGRKPGMFRFDAIVERVPGFYSHISNASIAYLLVAGCGYLWLMMGTGMTPVLRLALGVAATNVVVELWVPVLNTPDPVDAVYGLVGTAIAVVVLWRIDRNGLRPNPAASPVE